MLMPKYYDLNFKPRPRPEQRKQEARQQLQSIDRRPSVYPICALKPLGMTFSVGTGSLGRLPTHFRRLRLHAT
jgi:hypothetical protein